MTVVNLFLQIGEEWDNSLQSKEQIEANLLKKFEAAMKREWALAYAFTHQVIYHLHFPFYTDQVDYFTYWSTSSLGKKICCSEGKE